MVVHVDSVKCKPLEKYRSLWIAIDTALLEERAQEMSATPWDLRMALAVELQANSINIAAVHVNPSGVQTATLGLFLRVKPKRT
jgi:hypothetical protein